MSPLFRKYLLPALAALAIVYVLFQSRDTTLQTIADSIQLKLNDAESQFAVILQDSSFIRAVKNSDIDNPIFSELSKSGIQVCFFKNDSLSFWTDNKASIVDVQRSLADGSGIIHLKDGWYHYVKKSDSLNSEVYWGLLLVKYDFPFENRFLKNTFNPAFRIPDNVQLSEIKLEGSLPIMNTSGASIFHLYLSGNAVESTIDIKLLIAQFFLFCLLVYFLLSLTNNIASKGRLLFSIFFLASTLLAIRFFMILWSIPTEFYELILFSPTYYASSIATPSLGDLLLNTLFIFVFFCFLYSKKDRLELPSINLIAILLLSAVFISTGLVAWVFKTLVIDSTISFEVYNVLSLDRYSLIGMVAISFVLAAHYFITDFVLDYSVTKSNSRSFFIITAVVCIAVSLLAILFSGFWSVMLFSTVWTALLCITIYLVRLRKVQQASRKALLYLSFYALLTTFLIENLYERKERNQRRFFSEKLENERDYVAEFLFDNIQHAIAGDAFIVNYFKGTLLTRKDIIDRLHSLYLSGYFNRYDLSLLTFDAEGNGLRNSDTLDLSAHFKGLKVESFKSHSLFYASDTAKNYSYTSLITVRQDTSISGYLLIQLVPKTYLGQTVYPELLVGGNLSSENRLYNYDYAIYQNEKLVAQYGEFPYPYYWNSDYKFGDKSEAYIEEPYWEHTITKFKNGKKTVVSIPREPVFEPIATFSYLIAFYFTVLGLWMFVAFLLQNNLNPSLIISNLSLSFRSRINYSMLVMIVMSFLIIGGITINFSVGSTMIFTATDYSEKKK
ncbi:MAG: hypothetical protein IPH78_07830 [Bacteroidetes bacterium]|nr:hypothetical protein [Bacteroidota bacterium]